MKTIIEPFKIKSVEPIFFTTPEQRKAYIEEASNKETEKEILLQCLYVIAGKYPSLAQSEYRDSLDQFLISEAEMNCAVFLSDSEVRRIWNEA